MNSDLNSDGISVVWFKKDLRLNDHEALYKAIHANRPALLLFCFEPELRQAADADVRHWRFAYQSVQCLNDRLKPLGHTLYISNREALETLKLVQSIFPIANIYSHQETGNKLTFDRDKSIAAWCQSKNIAWKEYIQDGVIRGKKDRKGWAKNLTQHLNAPIQQPELRNLCSIKLPLSLENKLVHTPLPEAITQNNTNFQPGGENNALKYWHSFLKERGKNYRTHISKPASSRTSCSRISPYLAWGNTSIRQLWQQSKPLLENPNMKSGITAFRERLWWRGHFIQKLESQWDMEFHPMNPGFINLKRPFNENLFNAWANGQTGFPMVDSSMRCLHQTGWINFRMRAMLVSFASFTLSLPFQPIAHHLARLFLDYEPGIHYPQIQMQAGLSGYHTLRVYNPNIQASKHDTSGKFIHDWIPELSEVPAPQCHQPWLLTELEKEIYRPANGRCYPKPIVDFSTATNIQKNHYWEIRNHKSVITHVPTILTRHCIPKSNKSFKNKKSQSSTE